MCRELQRAVGRSLSFQALPQRRQANYSDLRSLLAAPAFQRNPGANLTPMLRPGVVWSGWGGGGRGGEGKKKISFSFSKAVQL